MLVVFRSISSLRSSRMASLAFKGTRVSLLMALMLIGGQITLAAQKVSLNLKSANIARAFRDIEKQTGYSIVYGKSQLKDALPVTLAMQDGTLKAALDAIFSNQPFTYAMSGRIIAVQARPAKTEEQEPRITVTGRVTDELGHPIPSVSVVIPGTPYGTMTNDAGEYRLENAIASADLIFSYVGFETQRLKIGGRTSISVVLKVAPKGLDEMVIIGYGATTKRKNTGSVASVTAEEIAKQPVANPLNALQGRVPGAIIYQSNGLPGSRVTVQIRGVNSLNSGQQPLFIIDGVPFNTIDQNVPATNDINTLFAANRGISPFSLINPSDIERIDVLKDADATAIYGTKAANGVVLITTKKGKSGKTKLDVNVYQGAGEVSRFVPMMNISQYLQMRREAFANDGITPNAVTAPDLFVWDTTKNTNWQEKYLGGTAQTTDAQATVSGGDARTRFLFGAGYHRETTVYPGDFADQRISVRFNADHTSLDKKFNAAVSANYSYNKSNLPSTDLANYYYLPPNMPVRNADGSLFWNANFENPDAYLLQMYIGKTSNLLANTVLRYTVLPGLDLKASLSYSALGMNQNQQSPAISKTPIGSTPTNSARFADIDQKVYTIEPQATYTRNLWGGRLNLLLGSTLQASSNTSVSITGNNYSNAALLGSLQGAGTYTSVQNPFTEYRYNSVFARINYEWRSKYILNLNGRRDGSSRFGSNNRFGNFGSVGAAWLFGNEEWVADKMPWLSFGKLRASYGLTGSDQIQDYLYVTQFSVSSGNLGYQGSATLSPNRINNPNLRWETNQKLEFALELGFLNDRLQLNTNYYRNRSGNQLGFLTLASQAGFNAYSSNFDALIQNSGWEFELNTTNISQGDFTWKTAFNLTVPQSKLLEASPQYFYFTQQALGKPLSFQQRFIYKGVDPQTGRPLYQDFSKDSLTFTPNFSTDRRVIGYTAPEWYGGLSNTFTYKNFDFSFFFQFTKQEGNIYPSSTPGSLGSGNMTTLWLDRWQQPGENAAWPRATTTTSIYSSYGSSNAIWGDASFVRLRNANLSYTLPKGALSALKISNMRVYLQGQNLFTWTKNKYVSDPETVSTINQASVVMAPLRVITAGLNCSF
ncbi:SusC/RagA family TonB-linked outer membrane protein [Chitinophaga horti]|uniref:SusC/RagA family TonB-linked outer membrane protein n=1 Tax=Chitinophaga horti TaxID=2920382 RepID=A0ABY6J7N2_9BACT|nr:SusC/RagA family TonB-linked outer membrane protein [Chitinophaga horti]UYQ95500.1 SusC/RagA family TonB-linked outer membrane protein [Chitinophaga horti]